MYNSLITIFETYKKYCILNTQVQDKSNKIVEPPKYAVFSTRWFDDIEKSFKITKSRIVYIVFERYIFYANEYLGTGCLLKETKNKTIATYQKRNNNSKLTIKVDRIMQMLLNKMNATEEKVNLWVQIFPSNLRSFSKLGWYTLIVFLHIPKDIIYHPII